jgi:hypothetical protein
MRIQQLLKTWGKRSGCPHFTSAATAIALGVVLLSLVAGCGGGSSSTSKNGVAAVTVSPTSISLVAGEVVTLTPAAVNSSNTAVSTTFTFHSSNTSIATVSPAGLVCGGVWDSIFVVCNGLDASHNPVAGSATITATAQGVSSGPVSVSVHPSVTSVSVEAAPSGCFSLAKTHQFKAHAFHNGAEITDQVGNFTWSAADNTVALLDANGLATARQGGITPVVASIGNTTSPAVFFRSCMPVLILLHIAGDSAGFTLSATMNATDTKQLQVDVIDENGTVTSNAPFTLISNNPAVATMSGATLTAVSPGGTGILAACAPPTCGNGINTPIYSNLFSVTVNGTSPNTTVYATSSFSPPIGNAIPLVPIDTSANPPKAGTAINLPGVPNSIVFDRSGARAFIGTNVGLAVLDAASNVVKLVASVPIGKVLAVSTDGTKALISNAANDPSTGAPIDSVASEQRLWVFDQTANTLTTFIVPGVVAATFDDDGFRAYAVADNGNVTIFSPQQTLVTKSIGGSSKDAVSLSSGPFAYVANSQGLVSIATCSNVQQANVPTNSTPIQLVGSVRNADKIVAMESTGLNIETVSTSSLTPPVTINATNCQQNVSYSNQFINFGLGPINARQLLVASNGSHIAVLPVGINRVLTAVPGGGPGSVTLPAGATQPLTGGLTPDGNTLWVGVAGANSVDRINLSTGADELQIPMTFLKLDGSPAPPDLVAIRPK